MRLSAERLADAHPYLATARPEWERSAAAIRREGGPWPCEVCEHKSLLCYRCSICGADLTEEGR